MFSTYLAGLEDWEPGRCCHHYIQEGPESSLGSSSRSASFHEIASIIMPLFSLSIRIMLLDCVALEEVSGEIGGSDKVQFQLKL